MENNNRLISLLSDYGFKITFANEKNQVFLRKAIQLLIDSPIEIKSVKHLPTEFEGMVEDSRKGFYDTVCKTDKGYIFMDKMQLILVELEKFTKLADEISNELEELLFTMKNAHNIDISNHMNIPHFWKKEWLQGVLNELNLSTMSPLNRALFNISVARHMAINYEWEKETKELARKVKRKVTREVTREVTKEVTREVTTNIKTTTAQKLLLAGKLSVEEIAETLEVEADFVLNVQKEMEESQKLQ